VLKFLAGYIWTQIQTTIHKYWVLYYTLKFCLKDRKTKKKLILFVSALFHDKSKYSWVEAKGFATTIFDLKHSTYGSDEYKELLKKIEPCLKHHYENNAHHPEFWPNGVADMNEIEKVEMLIDWRAATRRHKDGCIFRSIEINQKRFDYTDEDREWLTSIAKLIA
jgi:hypothetical protein